MVTIHEIHYLNNVLPKIPLEANFRFSDLITNYIDEQRFIRFWGYEETERNIVKISSELTGFFVRKGFALEQKEKVDIFSIDYKSPLLSILPNGKSLILAGSYEEYTKNIIQEVNQLKRLDWILEFMANHSIYPIFIEDAWKQICTIYPTIHVEYLEAYREQMFDKLSNDGYIAEERFGYKLTWKGAVFYEDGGYQGELSRRNEEHNRVIKSDRLTRINQKTIVALTFVLVLINVFPCIYYIQETKSYTLIHSFDAMVSLWIFLFGIIAGLIIYQLIQHQLEQRKSK